MIYRDAYVNLVNRFGVDGAGARVTAALNVVNSSAFRYYDVEARAYAPMDADPIEGADESQDAPTT